MRFAERYENARHHGEPAYAARGEHRTCDGYWLWDWQWRLRLRRLWHWPRAETAVAGGTLAPGTPATASATAAAGTRARMVLRPGTPVEATAVVRAEVVTVETVAAPVV